MNDKSSGPFEKTDHALAPALAFALTRQKWHSISLFRVVRLLYVYVSTQSVYQPIYQSNNCLGQRVRFG